MHIGVCTFGASCWCQEFSLLVLHPVHWFRVPVKPESVLKSCEPACSVYFVSAFQDRDYRRAAILTWFLWFLELWTHGKHFHHWAISPALCLTLYTAFYSFVLEVYDILLSYLPPSLLPSLFSSSLPFPLLPSHLLYFPSLLLPSLEPWLRVLLCSSLWVADITGVSYCVWPKLISADISSLSAKLHLSTELVL